MYLFIIPAGSYCKSGGRQDGCERINAGINGLSLLRIDIGIDQPAWPYAARIRLSPCSVGFNPPSGDDFSKNASSPLQAHAVPTMVRPLEGIMGRRQAVRQWILIPPCGGSNPPAPAIFQANCVSLETISLPARLEVFHMRAGSKGQPSTVTLCI